MKELKPSEVQQLFTTFTEYGADALKDVERLHLRQLENYINRKEYEILKGINAMICANPEYQYPNEYKDDVVEYWKERYSEGGANMPLLKNMKAVLETALNGTYPTFIKDIADLRDNCPLKAKIIQGMKEQIIPQADEQKELLPPTLFVEYIKKEIQSAKDAMTEATLAERRYSTNESERGYYSNNRILLYLWNKERIKALRKYLLLDGKAVCTKTNLAMNGRKPTT